MSHILFVVEKPESDTKVKTQWESFLSDTKGISERHSQASQLSEAVWLIPVSSALSPLGDLYSLANQIGLPCRAFLINGEVIEMNTSQVKLPG